MSLLVTVLDMVDIFVANCVCKPAIFAIYTKSNPVEAKQLDIGLFSQTVDVFVRKNSLVGFGGSCALRPLVIYYSSYCTSSKRLSNYDANYM